MTDEAKQQMRRAAIGAVDAHHCVDCGAVATEARDLGFEGSLFRCSKSRHHRTFVVPLAQSAKALDYRQEQRRAAMEQANHAIDYIEAVEQSVRT